jgi:hypothetical protein
LMGLGAEVWRKRVGIEPTRPGRAATPTDLKSARATRPHALPARLSARWDRVRREAWKRHSAGKRLGWLGRPLNQPYDSE